MTDRSPLWIGTGGTISCLPGKNGLHPSASSSQMKKTAREMGLETGTLFLMNVDSADMDIDRMDRIAEKVYEYLKRPYSRIVITHGTDTMAFTAAYLDTALVNVPIPVIFTGSQKPYFSENSDAVQNMRTAFETPLSAGVYIASYDRVITAKTAYKADSADFNAFDGEAPADTAEQSGELILRRPVRRKIGILYLTPYTTPFDIAAYSGYEGVVVCAYGSGTIPSRLIPSLAELGRTVRLAAVSQCRKGGIVSGLYETSIPAGLSVDIPDGCSLEKAAAYLAFCE